MSKDFLPYGRQSIGADDLRAVARTLRSSHLTQGPEVQRFEEAFARRVQAPYAVAVANGTAALHLAWLAAGLKPGEEVVTTPVTFVATSNSVLYAGGRPVFADVAPENGNLDPRQARKAVGPRTKGISPVHLAGQPCRFGRRGDYSARKDFTIVEDACHALGAEVEARGRWSPVGSCADSDMTVFSFHPVKHIASGEGGMITTRRRDLWEKLRLLRSHGIEKDPARFTDKSCAGKPWYYEMQALGFNHRISDIQCALGLSQLKKLDRFVARRRAIARLYGKLLGGLPHVQLPREAAGTRHSYHLYALQVDFEALGRPRESVMRELAAAGIGTQVHYIPVTRQPYYRERLKTRPADLPGAERYYRRTLSIPMYPGLSDADVRRAARSLIASLCPAARASVKAAR